MKTVVRKALLRLAIPVVALLTGVLLAFWAMKSFPGLSVFESDSGSRNTQIIQAMERKEQVVLLSLGIQGIAEKTGNTRFFGVNIPGSERALFLQYTFNAKLGLEGKDVRIEQTGENDYLLTIPQFKFIGHDKESFRLIAENNGILSWITPEIDPVDMINNILSDEAQEQYVASNQEILQDQARAFYTSIIMSVDPAATVTLDFRQ